jgi:hypothetical protein
MTENEVREYFESRYNTAKDDHAGLYAGDNYMIDGNTVWCAVVWALGPIWYIKAYRHGDDHYEMNLRLALQRPDTEFHVQSEIKNKPLSIKWDNEPQRYAPNFDYLRKKHPDSR